MTTSIVLWLSNAHVQATLGIGSVHFRTVDFGSAFFNWSSCVLCVPSDTLVLRCVMFIFGVKEADLGMMALVACFAPWISELYTVYFPHVPCTVQRVSNTLVQVTLGVGSVKSWSFTVAWTRGGGKIGASFHPS